MAELTIIVCTGRGIGKGEGTTATEGRGALGLNYPVSRHRKYKQNNHAVAHHKHNPVLKTQQLESSLIFPETLSLPSPHVLAYFHTL